MRNIPVDLSAFRLRVSEAPEVKMGKDKQGRDVPVKDRDGVVKFVVALMVKQKGQKGEEIRVTLDTDPGEGFSEDEATVVELIDPRVSPYSFKNEANETVSGVSFLAAGLKPVV